jgi:putative ABC transport system permease protein
VAAGDYLDWKNQTRSFQGLWAWTGFDANLGGTHEPERVSGSQITPGMDRGMGIKLLQGRDFLPEEGQPGHDHEVILRHKLWARRFGSQVTSTRSVCASFGDGASITVIRPAANAL